MNYVFLCVFFTIFCDRGTSFLAGIKGKIKDSLLTQYGDFDVALHPVPRVKYMTDPCVSLVHLEGISTASCTHFEADQLHPPLLRALLLGARKTR